MPPEKLTAEYQKTGVLIPNETYDSSTMTRWLELIRSAYTTDDSGRSGGRKYVTADKLYELGILQELITPHLKSLILALEPNPVFFHCHAYSIPHSQTENHIGFHDRAGWHRDHIESGFSANNTRAFSIFIYLTDVNNETNGAFELIPSYFEGDSILGKKSHRFFGQSGHWFLWDRSLFHRPHPNTATYSREIIKLSIQSNGDNNSRIKLSEFENLCQLSQNKDDFIHYLAGGHFGDSKSWNNIDQQPSQQCKVTLKNPKNNARVFYLPKPRTLVDRVKRKLISMSGA